MHHHTFIYKSLTLAVLIAGILVVTGLPQRASHAADVRTGQEYTFDNSASSTGDLYLLGKNVNVLGSVRGDLFTAGSVVTIRGPVSGDVLAAGGTVVLSAPVEGDARIAGGEVTINGTTSEDLIVAGGTVIVERGADIGGDLIAYADHLEVRGAVHGSVRIRARSAIFENSITGSADVNVSESLALSGDAHIGRTLTYSAPRKAIVSETARIDGATDFTEQQNNTHEAGLDWMGLLVSALVAFVSGITLFKLFPRITRSIVEHTLSNNGTDALVGAGILFGTPIVLVVLMLTVLGFIPALAVFALYGLGMITAFAASPILAGTIVARWMKRGDGYSAAWISFGAFMLSFITLMPVIGALVRFVAFLALFGTVYTLTRQVFRPTAGSSPSAERDTAAPVQHDETTSAESTTAGTPDTK